MSKPGPRTVIPDEALKNAKEVLNRLTYRDEILVSFIVVLTAHGKLDQESIGDVVGVSSSTIKRIVKGLKSESPPDETGTQSKWGGDRRSILTWEEENEVLEQLTPESTQGKIVTVGDIHKALEDKAGRKISQQSAYNVLYRHQWRKVAPKKVHPKNNPENLEEFKKKSFLRQFTWQPSNPSWREKISE
jgi:transposase